MDLAGRFEDTFCNIAIEKGDGSASNDSELYEEMKDYWEKKCINKLELLTE
ncbi:hypothetical protein [Aliikangiella sp. IMCC44359]|uniref:hypothetical protein n=1 Tax=Aliikangiella sp. IMCC44359 TaxID=3459125 RepID=UPI00403AE5CE